MGEFVVGCTSYETPRVEFQSAVVETHEEDSDSARIPYLHVFAQSQLRGDQVSLKYSHLTRVRTQ